MGLSVGGDWLWCVPIFFGVGSVITPGWPGMSYMLSVNYG